MRNQSYTPELIADAIQGKENALCYLYESTQDKITQTVRSMIRDEDAVLDIVQDSFVKAFRNLDKLDRPEYFLAWMRRIATNTAVDYLKKKRAVLFSELSGEDGTEIEFEDDHIEHLPDVLLDQKETSRLIRQIVSGLSEEQQLAIGLFYFEDMSIQSIAQQLGCSENTVKSRLNYGRKNIEKQVRELEKQGTKLYSLAPLPFFLLLLRNLHTQPSPEIIGGILANCGGVSAAAAGASASAGTTVAAKVAGSAAKKLAAKIVAGILAVTMVGGGAAVAISQDSDRRSERKRSSHSENWTRGDELPTGTTESEPETEPTQPEPDYLTAYQVILDELKEASLHPFDDGPYYYHFHDGLDLYYCLYDIDKNGIEELLIGRPNSIADIFTFDGQQTQWLVDRYGYGMQSLVQIMKTGEVYIEAPNTSTYFMQRLAEDGCSLEPVFQYREIYDDTGYPWYENEIDGSRIDLMDFNQMMLNEYTVRENLRWVQFIGVPQEPASEYRGILDEYAAACADEAYLEHREIYPNTLNDGMYYYHFIGPSDVSFAMHDIDQNGTEELLIGTPGDIWDVYALDGEKPVKLVDIRALGGGRANLTIMDTGELYVEGASSADSVSYQIMRMSGNGSSTETILFLTSKNSEYGSYYEGIDGNEHVVMTDEEFRDKMATYNEADISWVSLSEIPTPRKEAYQAILDEYTEIVFAMDEGTYDPEQMPHARPIRREELSSGDMGIGSGFTLSYSYYDIDRNGTEELLIGYSTDYVLYGGNTGTTILDVYTFDGIQAVQLFPEDTLGYTTKLALVNEGEMYLEDARQDGGSRTLARIAPDGYSLEVLCSYQTRLENGEIIYYNDTESYSEYDFYWVFPPLYYDSYFTPIEWTGFASYSD